MRTVCCGEFVNLVNTREDFISRTETYVCRFCGNTLEIMVPLGGEIQVTINPDENKE